MFIAALVYMCVKFPYRMNLTHILQRTMDVPGVDLVNGWRHVTRELHNMTDINLTRSHSADKMHCMATDINISALQE